MSATLSNLEMLRQVATRLGPLREQMVFLGGATVGLFLTDSAAPVARPTKDVDVIVEVASTMDYVTRLREALRAQGFSEDTTPGAPLCRWTADGIVLDVMPTSADVLGFSNRWYPLALSTAVEHALSKQLAIRVVTPPCFVATKLEAFRGRGKGDYQGSHDLEDLIAVVDGRDQLVDEILTADDTKLREYLSVAVADLLRTDAFIDALPGHLPPDVGSQSRLEGLLERLRRIAGHG